MENHDGVRIMKFLRFCIYKRSVPHVIIQYEMVPYYYTIPMIDGIYKVNRLLFDHCQILICNIDPVPTKIYGFRGMFNLNGMNALFGRFYNYPVVRGELTS